MSQTITAINHHSTTNNSTTRTAALRVAFYARVSSELQAQEQTIASQVAALKERIDHLKMASVAEDQELMELAEKYLGGWRPRH